LPENGVYTGDFEFLHSYQSISVLINTNVNGSVKYHFSNDGETIYHTEEFNIIGNTSFYKTVVKKGSYFRAEYINAGVAQDTFKLITIYRKDSPDIEFDNLDTVNCKQSGEWSFSLGETSNLYVSDALTHQKLDGINSNIFSVKNNTSDTAINTLSIGNDTSNIDGKMSFGSNNTLNNAQQVLLYGLTSGGGGGNNLHSVLVTGSGHVVCDVDNFPNGQETMALSLPVTLASDQSDINVKQNGVVNLGSYNNINNNSNISPGELSTLTVNIANMRDVTVTYSDISPDNFDSVGVEVSGDSVNFHEVRTLFPFVQPGDSNRSGFVSFNVSGFTSLRIRNKSSVYVNSNVNCSVYGSP